MFAHSGLTVPLYDTLGPETVEFVVNQTGLATVVCAGVMELKKLVAIAEGRRCPSLQVLCCCCVAKYAAKEILPRRYCTTRTSFIFVGTIALCMCIAGLDHARVVFVCVQWINLWCLESSAHLRFGFGVGSIDAYVEPSKKCGPGVRM